MKQEDIQTDEDAKQFFRDIVNTPDKYKDNHERITALLDLQNNYSFKRMTGGSVQEAVQHALSLMDR